MSFAVAYKGDFRKRTRLGRLLQQLDRGNSPPRCCFSIRTTSYDRGGREDSLEPHENLFEGNDTKDNILARINRFLKDDCISQAEFAAITANWTQVGIFYVDTAR